MKGRREVSAMYPFLKWYRKHQHDIRFHVNDHLKMSTVVYLCVIEKKKKKLAHLICDFMVQFLEVGK